MQTKIARLITGRINATYDTTIIIEKVDLSSLSNIELKNVLIKDHHNDSLIYVNSLSASIINLKNIFNSDLNFGDVEIFKGKLMMRTYKGEETNNLTFFTDKFDKEDDKIKKPFKLKASSILLENMYYSLTNENTRPEPIVHYSNISGSVNNFEITEDNVVIAEVKNLKTRENHKINITKLSTDFLFSTTKMEFLNTEIETENSQFIANIIFNYKDGDLSNFNDNVIIKADIENANIALTDLKKLYGEFGKNDRINFKTRFEGTLNNFDLVNIDLKSNRNFILRGNIHLEDVVKKENFKLDANFSNLTSNYDHLIRLFPKLLGDNMPNSIEKIGNFTSSGSVKINGYSVYSVLDTKSDIGSFKTDIELVNINDADKARYKGKIDLEEFNLGKFVNDSLVGYLTMEGEINGEGFTIDKINTQVNGFVVKHQYKGYTYTNIDINGVLKNSHFNGELTIDDPNLQLVFEGLADLSKADYSKHSDEKARSCIQKNRHKSSCYCRRRISQF